MGRAPHIYEKVIFVRLGGSGGQAGLGRVAVACKSRNCGDRTATGEGGVC